MQNWIKCGEQMPLAPFDDDEYADVEVIVFNGDEVFTAHYAVGNQWGDWVDTYASITHWQPLPEPPND